MGLIVPLLLLGLLASLSPSTVIVFILVLATTRARVNAGAFLVGWIFSLTVVYAVSYAVGAIDPGRRGGTDVVVDGVEILLGLGLVVLAARQWRRRRLPRGDAPSKMETRLRGLSPWSAAVLGVLEQPWTLTAAAAVVVVQHHAAFVVAVISFVLFTVLSTATLGGIYAYHARNPGEAQAQLALLRARLVRTGPVLVAGVSLLVGLVLVVDGVIGLAAG
jgi:hypothetical protein